MASPITPNQTPFPNYDPKKKKTESKQKVLLQRGTRTNIPDASAQATLKPGQHSGPHQEGENNDDIDRIMYLLNLNLQHRIKNRKSKTKKDEIQGLFGGK